MRANRQDVTFIRSHFSPIQPSELRSEGWLLHRSFPPPPELQWYIHSFWEMKGAMLLSEPKAFSIVPDGTVDLLFSLNPDEPGGFLSVTDSSATQIDLQGNVHYLGVRFFPGCMLRFFSFSFESLKGQTFGLEEVFGNQMNEWESRLLEAGSVERAIEVLSDLLMSRLSVGRSETDGRFLHSLALILQSQGSARIESQVADIASPRNLRRLFEHHTSLSPKAFAKTVRFQSLLRWMQTNPKNEWNKAFPDFGYFDQAHFIKEFKSFTGTTPTGFLL